MVPPVVQARSTFSRGNGIQAIKNDKEKWHMMTQGAGSPQQILALKDSQNGPEGSSLGPEVGNFLPYHLVDFWINLALCHALLVDTSDGQTTYQACIHTCLHGNLLVITTF
jgi:hypothetical protein